MELVKNLHLVLPECLTKAPVLANMYGCLQNRFKGVQNTLDRLEMGVAQALHVSNMEHKDGKDSLQKEMTALLEKHQDDIDKVYAKARRACAGES